ncbi:hypothetical protein H1R17_01160 [Flavobacterium sp. xlx-214]|uniref:hypothetical protein n=1 Tax=unclassified Flavobacterium TaxID=196869 RepID=UPI0013D278E3|nr:MULTISPECIES: hypothetical protein [unclassified Flavobacterium]MBA5792628.1 hypothetical protein [Flavobacterium sp. xlx-221]QMI83777.1 hypothetical protein H1R17_01160 [Flavobacterium sp. xlx-214]
MLAEILSQLTNRMKKYLPIFTTNNLTIDERWNILRQFIENWYDFEIPDTKFESQLIELENSLNLKLPKCIGRFFILASQLQNMGHTYTYSGQKSNKFSSIFRDCLDISFLEKHNALSLLIQAEQDTYWAIKRTDFKEENPKVYSYFLNYESDNNDFELYGSPFFSVTSFVLNHILIYLNNCSSFGMLIENVELFREKIKSSFENHIFYDGMELFEAENLIAFINEDLFEKGNFNFVLHLKENREIKNLPHTIIDILENKEGGWTSNRFNEFPR